jgi:hypothetical protein
MGWASRVTATRAALHGPLRDLLGVRLGASSNPAGYLNRIWFGEYFDYNQARWGDACSAR